HGRVDDAVGALVLAVGERDQLLADAVAVSEREAAHAADLVAALLALDPALGDDVVPAVVAVEVAQHRPDALDRRVDHGRADDVLQHRLAPAEMRLQRVEAALEDALADRLDELRLARLGAVE